MRHGRVLSIFILVGVFFVFAGDFVSAATVEVSINSARNFDPQTVTINAGDTIRWTNNHSSNNNEVSSDGHPFHLEYPDPLCPAVGCWDSPDIPIGQTYSFTFYYDDNAARTNNNQWGYHNHNSISKTGTVIVTDTMDPAQITNLVAQNPTSSSAGLSWTAPGDNGTTGGLAVSYDIRYSLASIDDSNWSSATQASGEPAPQAPGTNQSMTISGLTAGTTYYFAMKTSDEVPRISLISNVPNTVTLAAGQVTVSRDRIPPLEITDFSVVVITPYSVDLSWTAPGNDGRDGIANLYDIRYWTEPITVAEHTWVQATQAVGEPIPQTSGTKQTLRITGLTPGTAYYFAIKTLDEAPNSSFLSNVPVARTLPDDTPPRRTTGLPRGTLLEGTKEEILKVITDETGSCRYSAKPNVAYEDMGGELLLVVSESTTFTAKLTDLKDSFSYTYYVRCKDLVGNVNKDDFIITFSIGGTDRTPPAITDIKAKGGTSSALITWTTDEPSTTLAHYGSSPTFGEETLHDQTLTAFHSVFLQKLQSSQTYFFKVISADAFGNRAEGFASPFSFLTGKYESVPPVISKGQPAGTLLAGTTSITMSVKTDEEAVCRYTKFPGENFSQMPGRFIGNGTSFHFVLLTGLEEGNEYSYYIKCGDLSDNISKEDFLVAFSVEEFVLPESQQEPQAAPARKTISEQFSVIGEQIVFIQKQVEQLAVSQSAVPLPEQRVSEQLSIIRQQIAIIQKLILLVIGQLSQ